MLPFIQDANVLLRRLLNIQRVLALTRTSVKDVTVTADTLLKLVVIGSGLREGFSLTGTAYPQELSIFAAILDSGGQTV
jgi:hypothetical protein